MKKIALLTITLIIMFTLCSCEFLVLGTTSAMLVPTMSNVIDKADAKNAFSDAKKALEIYIAEKSTGNGEEILAEGSIFEVEQGSKKWYFIYENNGLTQKEDVNSRPYNLNEFPYIVTDDNCWDLPENVTIYMPYMP